MNYLWRVNDLKISHTDIDGQMAPLEGKFGTVGPLTKQRAMQNEYSGMKIQNGKACKVQILMKHVYKS